MKRMCPLCLCVCALAALTRVCGTLSNICTRASVTFVLLYAYHGVRVCCTTGTGVLQWKFRLTDPFAESLSLRSAAVISKYVEVSKTGRPWFVVQVKASDRPPLRILFRAALEQYLFEAVLSAAAQLPQIGIANVKKLLDVMLPALSASLRLTVLPSAADDSAPAHEVRAQARALVGTLTAEHERLAATLADDAVIDAAREEAEKAQDAAAAAAAAEAVGADAAATDRPTTAPEPGSASMPATSVPSSEAAVDTDAAGSNPAPASASATDAAATPSSVVVRIANTITAVGTTLENVKNVAALVHDSVVAPTLAAAGVALGGQATSAINATRGAGFNFDTAIDVVVKLADLAGVFPLATPISIAIKGIFSVYKVGVSSNLSKLITKTGACGHLSHYGPGMPPH